MEWIWLKMFGSLVLILGLIVGTMWLLKKFMAFNKPASGSGIALEVAGVLHLAPRRSVYAVKAGGQVILLGVAEHAVTYLTQLSDISVTAPGVQTSAPQAGIAAPFFGLLKEQFARTAGVTSQAAPAFSVPAPEPEREEDPVPAAAETEKKLRTVARKKAVKPI